ncbi:RHTO0S23e00650g1_1 [Rhodotorula toruloides]|uniref:3-methyl-2-oxobutanoate hydroxymethyltransferase n=1 Tax=Rhodotorula toruloides TaxID=5286 RepID=A0A061BMB3_RHOTO|nr:RHTO0S23e00650g1_1 [Rhodotorula toruloides]
MSTGSVARSFTHAVRTASDWAAPVASSSRLLPPARAMPTRAFTGGQRAVGHACACCRGQRRTYSSYPTERPGAGAFAPRRKRTIMDFNNLKKKKVPITMLTAHDYPSARFIESIAPPAPAPGSSPASAGSSTSPAPRGIDIALVGDSLAMVACGYPSTNYLTLDEMLYHCRSVARGCTTSFLVADLPFGSFSASVEDGVRAAVRLIQEGHMDAVKIEGGPEIVPLVRRLTEVGIPVMAHVGLTPQRQAALSGYRVQGKTVSSAVKVWEDARAVQDAGAFAVVLEAVPSKLAAWVTERLRIPTIGIGAGAGCDGQVLVQSDMLGVDSDLGAGGKGPRFLKKYADVGERAREAVRSYVDEVRRRVFPTEGEHTYPIEDKAWEGFLEAVEDTERQE